MLLFMCSLKEKISVEKMCVCGSVYLPRGALLSPVSLRHRAA